MILISLMLSGLAYYISENGAYVVLGVSIEKWRKKLIGSLKKLIKL